MSKISDWFNSGEFSADINNALTSIIRKAEASNTESETSSIFERELYFLIRSKLGIEVDFKKEIRVDCIVHTFEGLSNRQSGHGRIDAVVNGLIIEYKHCSKLNKKQDLKKAQEQVCDYLTAIFRQTQEKCSAILTDGIKIQYFSFVEDEVQFTSLRPLSTIDIDRIIRAILSNNTKKFDPSNLVKDFAISPQSPSSSKKIATALFNKLTQKSTEKTDMLYQEWKSLMHLSVNDNGKSRDVDNRRKDLSGIFSLSINNPETEYKALFKLHMQLS